ncbi:MAG TPA: TOMM precursor leader peptide-binding protein [Gemmataceae bacterium]|nr:TOMM precursor leader peptide-binding protein [Gemmataceae bacterium]
MLHPLESRRPRFAYPFTVLTAPDTVRLVAGEDHRYTLTAPGLDRWLPAIFERLSGKESVRELLASIAVDRRDALLQVVNQLYGERVLIDGSAADAHVARKYRIAVDGSGDLCRLLASPAGELCEARILVLCQDRLDYEETLSRQRACRADGTAFLWASTGPLQRAYVSPLFLPDAGPCLGCLFGSFQRLSPAPEIYDALRDHARQGKAIEPVEFPQEGLLILQGLIGWKLREAERDTASPGLYRLHVLDRERFEVTTHRVFVDPHCAICGKEPR